MVMDAADLKVFEAVARLGGMKRAAAELNTVQSNVTARIQALEADLGSNLLERHSRGVSLTPAGRRLLPYADKMARLLADARRATLDEGVPGGLLTIGSLESTAALRLTPWLTHYAADYPEVDLVLRTGTTCELVSDVLEQRVEGAFVCGPVAHADLEQQVMFREELAVLTAPGVTSLDSLFDAGEARVVVLRAGCSYRQRLENLLARRGIVVQRQLEFGTLEAIYGCVAAGLGITLLPRALLESACDAGHLRMHALPPSEATAETVFIRRRDGFTSSALRAFMVLMANSSREEQHGNRRKPLIHRSEHRGADRIGHAYAGG
jgi:LysR family transcriptional regulator, cell division regulator